MRYFLVLLICTGLLTSIIQGDESPVLQDNSNSLVMVDQYQVSEVNSKRIFDYLDREDGLSNMSISSIFQDKYGFMWFGTQSGLNRYDSESFITYRYNPFTEDGLPNNLIQTMYYDEKKHEIWVGTYGGLSRFIIDEERFINYDMETYGYTSAVIVAIEMDNTGNIWFGTLDGLHYLNVSEDTIETSSSVDSAVRALMFAEDGTLYIGSLNGLYSFDETMTQPKQVPLDLPSSYVMTVDEFVPGTITMGLWNGGIFQWNIETNITNIIEFDDNRIYSVYKTEEEILLVGTWGGGLFMYDGKSTIHYTGSQGDGSLNHPVIYSLYEDPNSILWIGTNGGGVNIVNPRRKDFLIYYNELDSEASLDKGRINELYIDYKDRLWVAVYNQGINMLIGNNEFKKIKYDETNETGLPSDSVRVIKTYKDTTLIGTDVGMGYYDIDDNYYEPIPMYEDLIVYDIEVISESEVWIGTNQNGIFRYNPIDGSYINYLKDGEYPISDDYIFDVYLDSKNRLWVGTNNGLNMKEAGSDVFTSYYSDGVDRTKISSNSIEVIYEDHNGVIWIGTVDGGIVYYDEAYNVFKSYTEADGISDNTVVSMLEDSEGYIWFGTYNGMTVLNDKKQVVTTLNVEDGIGGYQFSSASLIHQDHMYFTGEFGIISIPFDHQFISYDVPKMIISEMDLFKGSIDEKLYVFNNQTYYLDSDENFLRFSFTTLDYDKIHDNSYYYQLTGYDKTYINNHDVKSVSYSHLPHGEYTFNVYAISEEGVKTETASVDFVIKVPWNKSIPFYMIIGLLLFLFVFLLLQYRKKTLIDKKNRELADLNSQLSNANEKLEIISNMDSLTSAYNRRFLKKHLSEILGIAVRNNETYISVIMIDVDNFKQVNDTYGHVIGDQLLAKLSDYFISALPRSTDILARYGGDEFVVVLYDTDVQGTKHVAERLLGFAREINVKTEKSDTKVGITCSIGCIALIPDKDTTEEEILILSDRALYQAKESGKDQVVVIDGQSRFIEEK